MWLSLFDQYLEITVVPAKAQNHSTEHLQWGSSILQHIGGDGNQGLAGLLCAQGQAVAVQNSPATSMPRALLDTNHFQQPLANLNWKSEQTMEENMHYACSVASILCIHCWEQNTRLEEHLVKYNIFFLSKTRSIKTKNHKNCSMF